MSTANLINNIGCDITLSGTEYIIFLLEQIKSVNIMPLSRIGYQMTAQQYNVSVATVIKSIQYSIENVFLLGNRELLDKIFGYTVRESQGRPSNKQFILTLWDYCMVHELVCEH